MQSFDPNILSKTQVNDIMSRHAVTINAEEEFSKVHLKFINDHVTHIVVVDSENHVVGLISHKYLYRTQSPRKVVSEEMEYYPDLLRDGKDTFYTKDMLDSYILSKIMQKSPLTMNPEDSVAEAILHMANKKLGCIPIVNKDKKFSGVLTHIEIIKFLSRYC